MCCLHGDRRCDGSEGWHWKERNHGGTLLVILNTREGRDKMAEVSLKDRSLKTIPTPKTAQKLATNSYLILLLNPPLGISRPPLIKYDDLYCPQLPKKVFLESTYLWTRYNI